jgi:general secretion pathway protein I
MSNRSEHGFTVMELLVALAILVISMGLLFKLIGIDLDRTGEAGRETEATALLQSLLTQSEAAPQPGTTRGTFADGFSWQLAVSPESANKYQAVDAVDIAATVSWRHGDRIESRSLNTFRVVPKALPQ